MGFRSQLTNLTVLNEVDGALSFINAYRLAFRLIKSPMLLFLRKIDQRLDPLPRGVFVYDSVSGMLVGSVSGRYVLSARYMVGISKPTSILSQYTYNIVNLGSFNI